MTLYIHSLLLIYISDNYLLILIQLLINYIGTIRKAQFGEEVRRKQEIFMMQQKEDSEKKQEEKTKKMELAADFQFTEVSIYYDLMKKFYFQILQVY